MVPMKTSFMKQKSMIILEYSYSYEYHLYFLDPDDGARDTGHVLGCCLKVDLVALVKPNCGRGLSIQNAIPGIGSWGHPNRLARSRVREDGEDDIESRLLHNQARAGELHHGGVGRGA